MSTNEGLALTIGDLRQVIPMAFPDPSVEERFRSMLRSGDDEAVAVRITAPEESDVEGHAYGATQRSVWIKVGTGDGDDTEGHAISVHFPTVDEAEQFPKRLLAAGLLTGAVILGSVGAIAVSNLPAADVAAPANSAVYERPAGHGMLEGVDPAGTAAMGAAAAATSASGIDAATGKPARSGFLESADATGATGAAAAAAASSGIDAATGKPARSGFLEGTDAGAAASSLSSSTAERPAGHGPLEGE
jgi:hypothetical protein